MDTEGMRRGRGKAGIEPREKKKKKRESPPVGIFTVLLQSSWKSVGGRRV